MKMRKLLLISICILLAYISYAQDRSIFTCKSKDDCLKTAATLIAESPRAFKFNSERQSREYIIEYVEDNTEAEKPKTVAFNFEKRTIGGNAALEIEGENIYELVIIKGAFLDIFPMWKNHVDPGADMKEVSEKPAVFFHDLESNLPDYVEFVRLRPSSGKEAWTFSRSVTLKK